MRDKLATIQKVVSIEKHPNADTLEIVRVQGWKCLTKIGEFKVGENIIYCQVDSVLPEVEEFEFLRKNCFVNNGIVKGFRLKTIRLRGEYSQGLVLPLSILDGKKYPNDSRENPEYDFKENQDVTALLGIVQFERPIPAYLQGKVKGDFPTFIPKSDETRIQVLQTLLTEYKGTKCYITEKIDGTSCSMYYRDGEFGVCSRNLELAKEDSTFHERKKYAKNGNGRYQVINEGGNLVGEELDELPTPEKVSENVYWKMARIYDVENKLKKLDRKIAIQGEIYGEGLQKNPLGIKEQKWAIFSMYDITEQRYLSLGEMKPLLIKLGLELVPMVSTNFELIDDIDKLVEMSKGKSYINKNKSREGIVIRPLEYIQNNNYTDVCKAGRISFKAINPEYLVANDE
jgi:RNA ligase (TIGR02306 family)